MPQVNTGGAVDQFQILADMIISPLTGNGTRTPAYARIDLQADDRLVGRTVRNIRPNVFRVDHASKTCVGRAVICCRAAIVLVIWTVLRLRRRCDKDDYRATSTVTAPSPIAPEENGVLADLKLYPACALR